MNAISKAFEKALRTIGRVFGRISRKISFIIVFIVIVVIVTMLIAGTNTGNQELTATSTKREVHIESVATLSNETTPLPLLGIVTSRNEATIRAEGSGQIVGVYKKLGDYVSAGEVIAEFDNATERAQVLTAQGAYDAATAGKDIVQISRSSSDNALAEAKTQALNVIAAEYTGLDDAVRTKTDTAWHNPQTRDAKLAVTIADAKLVIKLEEERTNIEPILQARGVRNQTLTVNDDLVTELNTVESEANTVKDYLDDLSLAFNRAIPDNNASQAAIDGYKASAGIARGSVNGILTSITGARNALNSSVAANQIALANSPADASNTNSSVDAQIKSALGNLHGAQARLDQTIIRSPINGTINSLSINTGDYVPSFSEVAVVSNNGALEVVAYVTEDDAKDLRVGGTVTIEQNVSGVITRIAPALDPKTKKIEVRIGITRGASTLTNGQSVTIGALRTTKTVLAGGLIKVPLSALKITPSGTLTFTVSASSTLVAHVVTAGALLGDAIAITDGLTPDMLIVTDARGLEDGMSVTVAP